MFGMILESFLIKSDNWEKSARVFREVSKESCRPKKRYLLDVSCEEDVRIAKSSGIPILFVDEKQSSFWHYPMHFPAVLVIPREYTSVIKTSFRVMVFQSLNAFKTDSTYPRIEDFVVFMLSFDLIAARALIERNKELIDFAYLDRRIFEENLEAEAAKIHFNRFYSFPEIAVEKFPEKALEKAVAKNFVKAVL